MKSLSHLVMVLAVVLSPSIPTMLPADAAPTPDPAAGSGASGGLPPGAGGGSDMSGPSGVSVPRVMLSGFGTTPAQIVAGQDFDVNFTLRNTSTQRRVSNLKVTLASGEGAFLPATGSSSIYIEGINSGGEALRTMRFHSLPSLEEKSHQMTLTVDYEDKDANAFSSSETVAVQVKQDVRASATEPILSPATLNMGQDGSLTFNINNQGKSKLFNAKAMLPAGQHVTAPEVFVGTIEPGASGAVDMTVHAQTETSAPVKIEVSYEDSVGKASTITKNIDVAVQPPMRQQMEPEMLADQEPTSGFGWILPLLVLLVILGVVTAIVLSRRARRHREEQADRESLAMFDGEPLVPTGAPERTAVYPTQPPHHQAYTPPPQHPGPPPEPPAPRRRI